MTIKQRNKKTYTGEPEEGKETGDKQPMEEPSYRGFRGSYRGARISANYRGNRGSRASRGPRGSRGRPFYGRF